MARQATIVEGEPDASSPIRIVEADLSLLAHQEAVLVMVDAYSRDAMGDGKPLDQDVRMQLIPGLKRHPTTLIFLAFDGRANAGSFAPKRIASQDMLTDPYLPPPRRRRKALCCASR